jgi:hypothetical protein
MNMNTLFSRAPSRSLACSLAVAALVAGCGGGDDPAPSADTLSGVAAVGLPIVNGVVAVKCSSGPALASTTTNTTGNWLVTLVSQTLPCAVQVSGGSIGASTNTTPYHSIAVTPGTINISPLTDLMVAQLTSANPQTWFGTPVFTSVNANAVSTALNNLATGLGISRTLGTVNPITTAFAAKAGDPVDNLLEAFRVALTTVGQNYAATLRAAQLGNYTAFNNFGGAFSIAYTAFAAPPASGGGTTPPPSSGGKTLTVEVSISGVPATTVNVGTVPAPANQAEFCNDLQIDATFSGIAAAGGSLKINSCTFANNVGQISATLTTTVPIALSLPYSIKYTYN